MAAMTTPHLESTPRGRALTAYDVAELVEREEQRYELIDGVLSEMGSPSLEHQTVQANLLESMFAVYPRHLRILAAPYDILSEDTIVQPDILVIDRDQPRNRYLEATPHLAIEILSPSTELRDLNTKFVRYQRQGIPSYWVVDPIELRVIVWELHGDAYVEEAVLAPEDTWTTVRPFELTIVPGRLLD